jgi:endonuclease G
MTNILPQSPETNQGPWKRLEDFERTLAKAGNELYIIVGAFGSGGTGEIKVTKNKKIIKRIPVSATIIVGGQVSDRSLERSNQNLRYISPSKRSKRGEQTREKNANPSLRVHK